MSETKSKAYAVSIREEAGSDCDGNASTFYIGGLGRGFAQTMGTSLRRTLLSSVPGAAVKAVSIRGALHELDCVEGVTEDVQQIILNLRKIAFAYDRSSGKPEDRVIAFDIAPKAEGLACGDGVKPVRVLAGDLDLEPPYSVAEGSRKALIATVDPRVGFGFEIRLGTGSGFVRKNEQALPEVMPEGWIPVDASFSPVRRCAFEVLSPSADGLSREELAIEVETDGSITPTDALAAASEALSQKYSELSAQIACCLNGASQEEPPSASIAAGIRTDDLGLPPVLSEQGIETLGILIGYSEDELLGIPGIGPAKVEKIKAALKERGLSLRAD